MSSIDDLERIKANDRSFKEVQLDYGGRGHDDPLNGPRDYADAFKALRDNKVVKTLSLELDNNKRKLDKVSRLAFADMLSKNNTIEKVFLLLFGWTNSPCLELEPLMNVLTEHGEGIQLEHFIIHDISHSSKGIFGGVVEFLTGWPQAVKKLQLAAESNESPEQVLKEIASTQIGSLVLENYSSFSTNWYSEDDVAAAMEQPCFQLKELSMQCRRQAGRRFLDALSANTSITSLHGCVDIGAASPSPPPPNLVAVLPSLRNIQKLSLERLYYADLGPICLAVRRHGNIKSLGLRWELWDEEEQVEEATTTFAPALFQGLEEIDLSMTWGNGVSTDYLLQTTNSAFSAICSSLRNNPSIRKIALKFRSYFSGQSVSVGFSSLTNAAIPTMSNLHVLELALSLKEEHAEMLLDVVEKHKNLDKVTLQSCLGPSKTICDEINRQCEMNRIDYPKLLAADVESIPLALWPNILARVCQLDVRFELLREKNDVMLVNLPHHCGTKRSSPNK